MLVKNYTEYDFLDQYNLRGSEVRILNAGSSDVRYGENCVNVDIQDKPEVDIVCDLHDITVDRVGKFDAIICNAVLQYCHTPSIVARRFFDVLNDRGYLFVDAPWVQPYCPDTADRYRFSEECLRGIFSDFDILDSGVSIRPGSAFAMLGSHMASTLTTNKYMNRIFGIAANIVLSPFKYIRTKKEYLTAGAFYIVCRKPPVVE